MPLNIPLWDSWIACTGYGKAVSRMCFCKAQNCLMLSPLDIMGLFTYTKSHRNLNI